MFKLFKKDECKEVLLSSICDGELISIESVNDQMFSEKMLGDGVAFKFDGDTVYSPCEGKIVMIASSKHAFGIMMENGAELLIHVGLDTVNLQGEGLSSHVSVDEKVKKGQPLLTLDRCFLDEKNIDLTTPIVVTNGDNFKIVIERSVGSVKKEDLVAKVVAI